MRKAFNTVKRENGHSCSATRTGSDRPFVFRSEIVLGMHVIHLLPSVDQAQRVRD
jgi:hypothetical protein